MVKGISRQVIVVESPDPKLFEQAIFILKDDALGKDGITEDLLLKEATSLIGVTNRKHNDFLIYATVWASAGAFATGIVWLLSVVF